MHSSFLLYLCDVPSLRLWVCIKGVTFPQFWFSVVSPQAPLLPGVWMRVCPNGNCHFPKVEIESQGGPCVAEPLSLLHASQQQHLHASQLSSARVAGSAESSYRITVPLNHCSSSTQVYLATLLQDRFFFYLEQEKWNRAKISEEINLVFPK